MYISSKHFYLTVELNKKVFQIKLQISVGDSPCPEAFYLKDNTYKENEGGDGRGETKTHEPLTVLIMPSWNANS